MSLRHLQEYFVCEATKQGPWWQRCALRTGQYAPRTWDSRYTACCRCLQRLGSSRPATSWHCRSPTCVRWRWTRILQGTGCRSCGLFCPFRRLLRCFHSTRVSRPWSYSPGSSLYTSQFSGHRGVSRQCYSRSWWYLPFGSISRRLCTDSARLLSKWIKRHQCRHSKRKAHSPTPLTTHSSDSSQ